ncbi:hypothetical protein GCM10028857_17250 [Salinarchaeum chitinilyticum]
MSGSSAADRWHENRTTFQRVYDIVLGRQSFSTAAEIADLAECSDSGAREALEQLAEMGIVERRDGRPAAYRRNDAYLTWKRVEDLAREHDPETLRQRVDELIAEDESYQERYGVPDPDAVSLDDLAVDDHDGLHDRWTDLSEWRTVRRDVRVLRQAVQRAETRLGDGARA